MADRGFCRANGIHFAARNQAYVAIRLNPHGIRLQKEAGSEFQLPQRLQTMRKTGQIGQWRVFIPFEASAPLPARVCVIRKSQSAIALAHKKLRRRASKTGTELQPETLFYAQFVMILNDLSGTRFPGAADPGVLSLSVANRIGL